MALGWLVCFHAGALAQEFQSWTAASVAQKLPCDLDWSVQGQLRTQPNELGVGVGMTDVGVGWSPDVLPGWSLDGTWRTRWEIPVEGGWTASWRWATSVKWKTSVGDHNLRFRLRHQFGGAWMRPWDRARWRLQGRWTHNLPKGWKVMPSAETFLGTRWVAGEAGTYLEPMALRGRLVVDKKLTKRRHLAFGYQWQSTLNSFPSRHEHTLLMALDLGLKKAKFRAKARPTSE